MEHFRWGKRLKPAEGFLHFMTAAFRERNAKKRPTAIPVGMTRRFRKGDGRKHWHACR
jgi:hypothetical protein